MDTTGAMNSSIVTCLPTGPQYLPSMTNTLKVRNSLKAALLEVCRDNDDEYLSVLRSSVLVSRSFLHLFGDTLLESVGFLLISESEGFSVSLRRLEAYLALPLWTLWNCGSRPVASIHCEFSHLWYMEVKLLCDYFASLPPPSRYLPPIDKVTLEIPWTERAFFVDLLKLLPFVGARQLTLRCNGIDGEPLTPVNTYHFTESDEYCQNLRILEVDGPAFFDDKCFLSWTRSIMSQPCLKSLTLMHTQFDTKQWDDFIVELWLPVLEEVKLETGMSIGGLVQFLSRHPTLTALRVESGAKQMPPGEKLKFKLILPHLQCLHGPVGLLSVLLTGLGNGSHNIACLGILPDIPESRPRKLRLGGTDVAKILAAVPNISFLRLVFPMNCTAIGFGKTARSLRDTGVEQALFNLAALEVVRPGPGMKRSFTENIVSYIDVLPALRTVKFTESSLPPSIFRKTLLGRCPYFADQDIIVD